jgi:hypothetical protein
MGGELGPLACHFVCENKNFEAKKKNKIILAHMWRGIMYFINRCRFTKYIIHGLVFLRILRRCLRRNLISEMCVVSRFLGPCERSSPVNYIYRASL